MELTDIMALVRAGYTKDEITQMETPQPSDTNSVPAVRPVETPVPTPEPANQTAQVVEPVAVAVPAPQPAPQPAQPTMAELMQSIAKLTSAVQANAIAQSVIPAGISNPPGAEEMLAEIIRPTFKERS